MLNTHHLVLNAVKGNLKPRFIGPFRVEVQVGANVLKIALQATMWVHPVFNISLLQPYQGYYGPLGSIEVEEKAEYEVKKILQHCGNGKR